MIQRPEADTVRDPATGLEAQLEAVLFVAREPLTLRRLADLLGEDAAAVREALGRIRELYSGHRGVHLVEIAAGWRLLTNPTCSEAVAALHGRRSKDHLSAAALETLAIVAYKQPIIRADIERIRGVGVGPILRNLLELDLIKVAGREEGLGRALLYATTRLFLDHFGLASIRDLPASLEV